MRSEHPLQDENHPVWFVLRNICPVLLLGFGVYFLYEAAHGQPALGFFGLMALLFAFAVRRSMR